MLDKPVCVMVIYSIEEGMDKRVDLVGVRNR
jgi:hypothetical protein